MLNVQLHQDPMNPEATVSRLASASLHQLRRYDDIPDLETRFTRSTRSRLMGLPIESKRT